jgi:hypothetical protein
MATLTYSPNLGLRQKVAIGDWRLAIGDWRLAIGELDCNF